jgi:hypothetical protein
MTLLDDSNMFMDYIFNKKEINNNKNISTQKVIKKLYDDYCYSKNYVMKQNILLNPIINKEHLVPTNFSKYFPLTIKKYIEQTPKTFYVYTIKIMERNFKIQFIDFLKNSSYENICYFNNFIMNIVIWFYMLKNYSNPLCCKSLSIFIYMTPFTKKMPSSNSFVLDASNINTAFTTSCPVDGEIIIYRKEEWFKVLIHESFHAFGVDFSNINTDDLTNKILTIYKVNSDVNLFETYSEFWAEIINIVFCSNHFLKYNKISIQNNEHFFSKVFLIYLNIEKKYTLFQVSKILDFMGISYKDLFNGKAKQNYKEKTNILAYYIIKLVLIYNYDDFFLWYEEHKNPKIPFQFQSTEKNKNDFIQFIKDNCKNKNMLGDLQKSKKIFYKLRKNPFNNNFILNNLRMTMIYCD